MNKLLLIAYFIGAAVLGANAGATSEAELVSWCLYQEARGESWKGKMAVASVLYNRRAVRGLTYREAITQPNQFSGVDRFGRVPDWYKQGRNMLPADAQARIDCNAIAGQMIYGGFKPIGAWDHYYAHKITVPRWAQRLYQVEKIGNHTFGVMSRMYY
jgi:spore germination cell wall hydrolase CwlJ-like protein